MKKKLTVIGLLLFSLSLFSQPANDDCSGLIDLGEAPICPVPDTFTNVDATLSEMFSDPLLNIPACFNGGVVERDVWFSFTVPSSGAFVNFDIRITGVDGPNGGMQQPQFALYRGECLLDELQELDCASSLPGESEVELEVLGLTPGLTYFLRVSDWSASATPNWGDFVLCVKEPDPIFIMGEDASTDLCEGILYDSGGEAGNYLNSENATFTICPQQPSGCIDIQINEFAIESGFDNLTFFAGNDTNAPQMGTITGSGGPISLQAGSECVTVQFTSDFSVTQPGFEMTWQCSPDSCETTFVPCEETQAIFSLPFSTNGTTCNSGNDVQTGPCANSDELLEGEDFIYTYNPSSNQCIEIVVTGANLNTGLSLYNGCPESASECMGFAENTTNDSLVVQGVSLTAFQPLFIVLSNGDGCTDFNIQVNIVDCPATAPAQPICEDAILLNNCQGIPDLYAVGEQSFTNPDYFQPGVNDGCWSGIGEAHYTWLFFQAQNDGEFGFIAQNGNALEESNINIQVWGPIDDFDTMCDFIAENQPARSTGALNAMSSLTGLTNSNPIDGTPVSDDCEGDAGDGFVNTLPVENEMIYLILINDFEGNIVNGGIELDFSPTSAGVLDGLPSNTPLSADEFTLNGDAIYTPQNFDYSCIQITAAQNSQSSCVWAAEQVNFLEPFSQNITVYLGDNDAGADGICMVYHQNIDGPNACGLSGGGIGAENMDNSFIIEFDTWQNVDFGDPFQDHIAVNINGDMANPIGGPAILPNIEDGVEHIVTFNWDPTTNSYEIYFDGTLQITGTFDIIQNCFQGSSMAYCGFTGSTGGANNLQYACTGDQVYPTVSSDSVQVEICQGDSIEIGGTFVSDPGVYTETFPVPNACDSILYVTLTVLPGGETFETLQICEGDTVLVFGDPVSTAGVYSEIYNLPSGCDSTHTVTVEISITETFDSLAICEGDTVLIFGNPVSMAGVYSETYNLPSGCDSTHTVTVAVSPAPETFETIEICDNESVEIFGNTVNTPGDYSETFTTAEGCDSIHTITLVVNPTAATSEDISLCDGESTVIFGDTVSTEGIYEMTFTAANGCDSTHTVTVTVLPTPETFETIEICDNESVEIFGNTVNTPGDYSETFTTAEGCDSTHTITLVVNPTAATAEDIFLCFGETVVIFGDPVGTSGTYEMTFTGANGCDSTHTVNLTVNDEITIQTQVTDLLCFGDASGSATATASGGDGTFTYLWSNGSTEATIDGVAAGTYSVTATDGSGCFAEATVTISQPDELIVSASGVNVSCDELGSATANAEGGTPGYSYEWNTGDTDAMLTELEAGIYSVTATDENGCIAEASVEITGALGPEVSISIDQLPTEDEPESGALTATVTGGTAPFDIEWSNSDSTLSIDGLASGEYTVVITDANGCTAEATEYIYIPGCTGGKIWNDINRDGCQMGGELGIGGIEMELMGTDIWGNDISMTTTTAINGEYIFEPLPPGDYQVLLNVPSGYTQSPMDNCADDFVDSDFNSDHLSFVVDLAEGHCCLIVDGGIFDACLNVADPGAICCDQVLCGPGNDPAPLTSISPATGAGGPIEYMWMYSLESPSYSNGTWVGIPGTNSPNYDPGPLSQTTYFARCVRAVGCTEWLETNVVEIFVDNQAVAEINGPSSACVGDIVTYSAPDNGPGATYHWYFGPWASPSSAYGQEVEVTWNQAGIVFISLNVTANDCTSNASYGVAISSSPVYCGTALGTPGNTTQDVGVSAEKESGFTVYPNPISNVLNIERRENIQTEVRLEILSLNHRILRQEMLASGDSHLQVELTDLPPGMYMLRLRNDDGEMDVFKLVKL